MKLDTEHHPRGHSAYEFYDNRACPYKSVRHPLKRAGPKAWQPSLYKQACELSEATSTTRPTKQRKGGEGSVHPNALLSWTASQSLHFGETGLHK